MVELNKQFAARLSLLVSIFARVTIATDLKNKMAAGNALQIIGAPGNSPGNVEIMIIVI